MERRSLDPSSQELVRLALQEDLLAGDLTSEATLDPDARGCGQIVARASCVLAGVAVARAVFAGVDPELEVEVLLHDGAQLERDDVALRVRGRVCSILSAERTALNFVRHLSGVATQTARYVAAAGNPKVRLVDTRKTTPGMRRLEKDAVRAGGGHNHRFALGDGVLIKDNHLLAAGGVRQAVERARAHAHHLLKVEVEVATFAQLDEALAVGAEVILLDNMSPAQVAAAVQHVGGRAVLEASGGIDLGTIAAYAATGVDLISVGALTHSAPNADLSLDLVDEAALA